MTKCGRYGTAKFDYSPATIRESVTRSLERLKTDYLDTVYLHDVEFVCTPVAPRTTGYHVRALTDEAAAYGLAAGDEATVRGEGDQKILDAFHTLQELQSQGLIKHIGITGMSLLLRITAICDAPARLSSVNSTSPCNPDPAHGSLQAGGRDSIVLAPLPAEHDVPRLRSSLLRARSGWPARPRFPAEYGYAHADSATMAPCAAGAEAGGG